MDFDYKVFGKADNVGDCNASALVYYKKNRSDVFLHPAKCFACNSYFDDIEEQTISSLNHEVQESLVLEILMNEKGDYNPKWFDETSKKIGEMKYYHECDRCYSIIHNSGYIR